MELCDAHCHLQDDRLPAEGLAEVLVDAAAVGVTRFACNGCCEEDWERVLEIARSHPGVIPNVGLHPWWVAGRSPGWLDRLRKLLVENPDAGLGECGLDNGPRAPAVETAVQAEAFERQLALAQELRRPVTVHCVRAFGPVCDALRRLVSDVPVVLHSWTGAHEVVAQLLHLRAPVYFSLSGHLAKVPPHKAIPRIQAIPLDRLLLESDSPDGALRLSAAWLEALPQLAGLPPRLERFEAGNTPAAVQCTLELVAAVLGRPAGEVAAATHANYLAVFGTIPVPRLV